MTQKWVKRHSEGTRLIKYILYINIILIISWCNSEIESLKLSTLVDSNAPTATDIDESEIQVEFNFLSTISEDLTYKILTENDKWS